MLPVVVALALATAARADGVVVTDVSHERTEERLVVRCEVGWRRAWNLERNHDAVWVFVKARQVGATWWRHAHVSAVTAERTLDVRAVECPGAACEISEDGVGVFVSCGAPYVDGYASYELELDVDPASLGPFAGADALEFDVLAIEMVEVPEGPYWLGAADEAAIAHSSFFRRGTDGEATGPYRVESEDAIEVGGGSGTLGYRVPEHPEYRGDRGGPIPAAFPKGTRRSYVMKYELSQGEYAAFLDHLPDEASALRANFAGRGCREHGCSIQLVDGRYVAIAPRRPANFVSWDDGCAFLDWAGLRPMTELEYEKICRGPEEPVEGDYPWGTASTERIDRRVDANFDLVVGPRAQRAAFVDAQRDTTGASCWFVMDLAGSLWERVVSAGSDAGRAFEGSHGDGMVTWYGSATNADWPRGDDRGTGGYGYRGGGWYGADHEYAEGGFNPWSPVAWRPFAAWSQGPRHVAYGIRGVRTAPEPRDGE
ncbi:MAG: hypothetical protein R3F34_18820 [Planctomycetota bacterium]